MKHDNVAPATRTVDSMVTPIFEHLILAEEGDESSLAKA